MNCPYAADLSTDAVSGGHRIRCHQMSIGLNFWMRRQPTRVLKACATVNGDGAFYRDAILSVMCVSRSQSTSAVTISLTPSTKRLWYP